MPLNTLPKTSAFWNNPALEPKRQYRFKLLMDNIESWMVKSVSRPNFSVTETPHQYINHTFYYPGRVEWEPVSFTLVDPIQPDATGKMMAMLMGGGYRFPVNKSGIRTPSKEESVNALGTLTIQMFHTGAGKGVMEGLEEGTEGADIIESWTLKNPFIVSANFGELSYDGDDLTNLEVSVRYDWATWNPGNRAFDDALGGVNTSVTRDIVANGNQLIAGGG
tara:strand:+ start:1284 stop:1946 length:663 start_codon:yes stop_codon:yes gene_type:complete